MNKNTKSHHFSQRCCFCLFSLCRFSSHQKFYIIQESLVSFFINSMPIIDSYPGLQMRKFSSLSKALSGSLIQILFYLKGQVLSWKLLIKIHRNTARNIFWEKSDFYSVKGSRICQWYHFFKDLMRITTKFLPDWYFDAKLWVNSLEIKEPWLFRD